MQIFTEIFYGRSADFSALNGRAVVIISVFRKEKTVCIFLFIRQILPSTVRFMQSAQKKQSFVENCPHFCEKYTLTYPEHLHMIGRYNSLFGLDLETLMHPEILKEKEEAGIDRFVLGLI